MLEQTCPPQHNGSCSMKPTPPPILPPKKTPEERVGLRAMRGSMLIARGTLLTSLTIISLSFSPPPLDTSSRDSGSEHPDKFKQICGEDWRRRMRAPPSPGTNVNSSRTQTHHHSLDLHVTKMACVHFC